jgi:hypothetical protein
MFYVEFHRLLLAGERRLEAAEMQAIYCMGQGKERRDKVMAGNEEVGQTNTGKEEKLAGTSREDAIRKSSLATSISVVFNLRYAKTS